MKKKDKVPSQDLVVAQKGQPLLTRYDGLKINRFLPEEHANPYWDKEASKDRQKMVLYRRDPRTLIFTQTETKQKFRLDHRELPRLVHVPIKDAKPIGHRKVELRNSWFKTKVEVMAEEQIDGSLTLSDAQCVKLRKALCNLKMAKLTKRQQASRLKHADYAGCWPVRVVSIATGGAAILVPKPPKVKPPKPPKPERIPSAYGKEGPRALPRNKTVAYALSRKPEGKLWTGAEHVPLIGERVRVTKEDFGYGTVVAYFYEHRVLGVEVKLDKRPTWHLRQCKDKYPHPLVFGESVQVN